MYYIVSAKTGNLITRGMCLGIARKVARNMLRTGFANAADTLIKITYHHTSPTETEPIRHTVGTLADVDNAMRQEGVE